MLNKNNSCIILAGRKSIRKSPRHSRKESLDEFYLNTARQDESVFSFSVASRPAMSGKDVQVDPSQKQQEDEEDNEVLAVAWRPGSSHIAVGTR